MLDPNLVTDAPAYLAAAHQQINASIKALKQNQAYCLPISMLNITGCSDAISTLQHIDSNIVVDTMQFNAKNMHDGAIFNRLDFDYEVTPRQHKVLSSNGFEQRHPNIALRDATHVLVGTDGVIVAAQNGHTEDAMRHDVLACYQQIKRAIDWPKILNDTDVAARVAAANA